MAETDNRKIVQGEDIIILLDDKPTLHATTHNLKVDLELKDIRTKALRSNNPCNVVRATIAGLAQLRTAEEVAALRGKTTKEIL